MKNFSYVMKAAVLILWIPVVLFLFRFVGNRQTAAFVAGIGFIVLPTVILIHEIVACKLRSRIAILSCFQFLIFFAWPIFLLRIFNWETEFNDILFLGASPAILHQYSSWSYLLMVLAVVFEASLSWRNKKRQP